MTRQIRYTLADPTGNITLLIESAIPAAQQPAAAASVMRAEPTAEQAGFLSDEAGCDIALRMAGGEFCANAAMSAAAYHARRAGMTDGQVSVRVSGAPAPIAVKIALQADGLWCAAVGMPQPRSVETVRFPDGQTFPIVFFPGIAHVIAECAMPHAQAEQCARQWCAALQTDALGIMFLDLSAGTLKPLVYVPAADTIFWESACGSGTSAVGAYLAKKSGKPVNISLRQPGGSLTVFASPEGGLRLGGTVRLHSPKTLQAET